MTEVRGMEGRGLAELHVLELGGVCWREDWRVEARRSLVDVGVPLGG